MTRLRPPTSPPWRGKLIVFIVLGAIVNVAVAWGCAAWLPISTFRKLEPHESDGALRELKLQNDDRVGFITCITNIGRRTVLVDSASIDDQPAFRGGRVGTICDAGWPMLCLHGTAVEVPVEPSPLRPDMEFKQWLASLPGPVYERKSLIALPERFWRPQIASFPQFLVICDPSLPFGVIWPGFAINTIFYAAILWMLFAAPLALRRWRRIKRGLCPACAYPVGTSDICTECGKPVSSRRDAGM